MLSCTLSPKALVTRLGCFPPTPSHTQSRFLELASVEQLPASAQPAADASVSFRTLKAAPPEQLSGAPINVEPPITLRLQLRAPQVAKQEGVLEAISASSAAPQQQGQVGSEQPQPAQQQPQQQLQQPSEPLLIRVRLVVRHSSLDAEAEARQRQELRLAQQVGVGR